MSMNGDGQFDMELFPCSGGLAEGFRRAGITFDMAVEFNQDHCDSYEENLGHAPLMMDVRALWEMLKMGWRSPCQVRLLLADPPCVSWSRSGKRLGINDPRDMLEGTVRIIELLQPQIYLIGNVPGLDDGPNLHIVQRLIGGLSKHGYCTADFARLNAVNYGVPQHRIRPWWFGHRPETPCIMWPEPSHADPHELTSMALPIAGVRALEPWITCRKALGHLSPEELGRPIRLRKREKEPEPKVSKVMRAPTSANLTLFDEQPKRRGRRRDDGRAGQGNRVGDLDRPSATVTAKAPRKGAGQHAVFTLQPPRGSDGGLGGLNTLDEPAHAIVRNTHGNGSILVLNDKHPAAELDKPSPVIGAKQRQGAVINMEPHHPASRMDEPAMTVRAGSGGGANRCLELNDKHAPPSMDEPCTTIRGGGEGHSAPPVVIRMVGSQGSRPVDPDQPAHTITAANREGSIITTSSKHPASPCDGPAMTVRGSDGAGVNRVVEWPWDRPCTTVQGDPRIAPPGHHDEDYAIRSLPGGVVISEKAAAILQGFPLFLVCSCGRTVHERQWEPHASSCATCGESYKILPWKFAGKTKKVRFSQLGQAMPSALAHAVGTSVVQQLERSKDSHRNVDDTVEGSLPTRRKQDGSGTRTKGARGVRGREGGRDLDDAVGVEADRRVGPEGPDVAVALPAQG